MGMAETATANIATTTTITEDCMKVVLPIREFPSYIVIASEDGMKNTTITNEARSIRDLKAHIFRM